MAFEKHAAALFLKLRSDGVKFGRVLTLGHQSTRLSQKDYVRVLERLGRPAEGVIPLFADDLLLALGGEQVQAMDFSGYEGAHLVHDLNQPVPKEWHEQYDLIFDGGTLEHVFNFPAAIKNCMQMLKPGGRIVSVTIPNNWCGHGFYQFSPELFYRVFSPASGFSVIEMYVAVSESNGPVYAVKDPAEVRSRVELCNDAPLYLLVHARRDEARPIFTQTPQQSDYEHYWSSRPLEGDGISQSAWRSFPRRILPQILKHKLQERRRRRGSSLANRNHYTLVDLRI